MFHGRLRVFVSLISFSAAVLLTVGASADERAPRTRPGAALRTTKPRVQPAAPAAQSASIAPRIAPSASNALARRFLFLDSSTISPPESASGAVQAEHSVLLTIPGDDEKLDETPVQDLSSEGLVQRAALRAKNASTVAEFDEVIGLCREAARRNASDASSEFAALLAAWAANRKGELAASAGDKTTAAVSFQAAVELDAENWRAIHNRGVSRAIQGESAAAISDLTRAIELNPNFAPAYRNRGELRCAIGLIDDAINDFSKAIVLAPSDSELYRIRGQAEHRKGDFAATVRDLNLSIQNDPRNAHAYCDRGNVYAELGYYRQALKDYREALEIDDSHYFTYRSVAWLLATCPETRYRRSDKALVAARRAIAVAPSVDPLDFDVLAAAEASAGQFAQAIATEKRAVQLAGAAPIADEIRRRLALFQRGKAFIAQPRDYRPAPTVHPAWASTPIETASYPAPSPEVETPSAPSAAAGTVSRKDVYKRPAKQPRAVAPSRLQ